jgi:hypothetical protein
MGRYDLERADRILDAIFAPRSALVAQLESASTPEERAWRQLLLLYHDQVHNNI